MNYNVLVIGIGALGKRHLSSILNSHLDIQIFCYDKNKHALDDRDDMNFSSIPNLKWIKSFEELPEVIDFALFSMTAQERRKVFDDVVKHTLVKNILFEKVLFQTTDDYYHVSEELRKKRINAWVNCSRRQMDSYQLLRKQLKESHEMQISFFGGEWGMACNSVHLLDLVSFLSGSENLIVSNVDFIPQIFDSKRIGYKEVYGRISGNCGKCKSFSINCLKDTGVPFTISIATDKGYYYVLETKGQIIRMTEKNDFNAVVESFEIPYQSQMTQYVMEDILNTGNSRLTTYENSKKIHLVLLKELGEFFSNNGYKEGICPIT